MASKDKTGPGESAQALFSAIADDLGDAASIFMVLNLRKYPTFERFEAGAFGGKSNRQRLDDSAKWIDTTSSLTQIEEFLKKETGWYKSAVLIAVKMMDYLTTETSFSSWSDMDNIGHDRYYIRGDKIISDGISTLFKTANTSKATALTGSVKFADINKWSPADIYYAQKSFNMIALQGELKKANANPDSYTFGNLNLFISEHINNGVLLPLSLKKQTKSVKIQLVNFVPSVEQQLVFGLPKKGSPGSVTGGLWYKSHTFGTSKTFKEYKRLDRKPTAPFEPVTLKEKKSAPTRDIQINISENQSRSAVSGIIKLRHDASTNAFKAEFIYTKAEARGGSVGSHKKIVELMQGVDSALAENFNSAIEAGRLNFKNKMKNDYVKDKSKENIREVGKKPPKDIDKETHPSSKARIAALKTMFPASNSKDDPFINLRGEESAMLVMNEISPIINKFLNANSSSGNAVNSADELIRIIFMYVTSRMPNSGKFVIAK